MGYDVTQSAVHQLTNLGFKVDPDSDTDSDPDNHKRDSAATFETVNNRVPE
jgi:hypothetical protein